jgi:hypothetical protein
VPNTRRVAVALVVLPVSLLVLTAARTAPPEIVGAWCGEDGGVWEFFGEGTTLWVPLTGEPAIGDYRYVDDHRIRVDWGGTWSMMVGPAIYSVERGARSITLTDLQGGTSELQVCTAEHERLREALHDAEQACSVNALEREVGDVFEIRCPADCPVLPVWGSGPYTADSSVCSAARHAGRVPAEGGVITAIVVEGQPRYPASERHGVQTNAWGAYPRSFILE